MSPEESEGPSAFVIRRNALEGTDRVKVKEALHHLAQEQTGSAENAAEDHRADPYSPGIFFWILPVGRGTIHFEGGALQILHVIAQKRPVPVYEIRRDVPPVLAAITENGDERTFSRIVRTDFGSASFQDPGNMMPECTGRKE